jgi:hypothetical protein
VTRAWPIHEAGIALYRTVMIGREAIRQRWRLFGSKLDERGQPHFAAVEARTAGRGGIVARRFYGLLRNARPWQASLVIPKAD